MTATAVTAFPCPRCGIPLFNGQLDCPKCGALVHARQLSELSQEAFPLETENPLRAAMIWQRCLPLLPRDSQQYQMVLQRVGMLSANLTPPPFAAAAPQPAVPPRNDTWLVAVIKTVGSMLISIAVYTLLFGSGPRGYEYGLKFATGFVLLMLVHELGHSFAIRHYKLSASPPIFIPFLGAVINLRQPPRNAMEEAIVGIAGPWLGTIGAIAVYLAYVQTGSELMLRLAAWGIFLNLFNLLPVPPLDGGRVTAALSPWMWVGGFLFAIGLMFYDVANGVLHPIMILLLLMAWPRIKQTLFQRARHSPYYNISKSNRLMMGVAYIALAVFLGVMHMICPT